MRPLCNVTSWVFVSQLCVTKHWICALIWEAKGWTVGEGDGDGSWATQNWAIAGSGMAGCRVIFYSYMYLGSRMKISVFFVEISCFGRRQNERGGRNVDNRNIQKFLQKSEKFLRNFGKQRNFGDFLWFCEKKFVPVFIKTSMLNRGVNGGRRWC